MNLRIVFKFKDCKLQFYGKRKLFSYFSVNPRTPASRQRRLLKLKRKKITLLRLSLASFSPHHYSQQQRSSFLLFITRQKESNALKSLKLKKKLTGIEQASDQVPFSTSHLQLALAHARNSRVKKNDKFKLLFNLEMLLSLHFRTTITVCISIFRVHNFLAYIKSTCSNKVVMETSNLLVFIIN